MHQKTCFVLLSVKSWIVALNRQTHDHETARNLTKSHDLSRGT